MPTETQSIFSAPGICPDGWTTAPLSEYATVIGGGTPKTEEATFWDGDIPWATPTEITRVDGGRLDATDRSITTAGLKACSAKLLPRGTLLMTSRATIGATAIAQVPMATNQGFQNLVPKDNCDVEFLQVQIQSAKGRLTRLAQGSTFLEISPSTVKKVEFHWPLLEEQRRIAALLNSIEAAIAAGSNSYSQTAAARRGVVVTIADMSLLELLHNGPVEQERLDSLAKCIGGYGFPEEIQGRSSQDATHPFYKVSDMNTSGNEVRLNKANHYIDDRDLSERRYKLIRAGSTVFAKVGAALMKDRKRLLTVDSLIDNNMMAVSARNKNKMRDDFLFHWFEGVRLAALAAPGPLPSFNAKDINSLHVPTPPMSIQGRVVILVAAMDDALAAQRRHLDALRNAKRGILATLTTRRLSVEVAA